MAQQGGVGVPVSLLVREGDAIGIRMSVITLTDRRPGAPPHLTAGLKARSVLATTPQWGTRMDESGATATVDSHRVSPLPGWRTRWQPRRKMPRERIAVSVRD